MAAAMDTDIFGDDADDDLGDEIARADPDEIVQRTRMLENEIKVLRNETARLRHEQEAQKEKIKENTEKIKLNKQLPFLVANVVELLDLPEDETEEDGANVDLDATRKGKSCVLKTSTRQTIFLPIPGLVEPDSLKPADMVPPLPSPLPQPPRPPPRARASRAGGREQGLVPHPRGAPRRLRLARQGDGGARPPAYSTCAWPSDARGPPAARPQPSPSPPPARAGGREAHRGV